MNLPEQVERGLEAAAQHNFVDDGEVRAVFGHHQRPYRWTRPAFDKLCQGIHFSAELHRLINPSPGGSSGLLVNRDDGLKLWRDPFLFVVFREVGDERQIVAFGFPEKAPQESHIDQEPFREFLSEPGLENQQQLLRKLAQETGAERVYFWVEERAKPVIYLGPRLTENYPVTREWVALLPEMSLHAYAPRCIPMDADAGYEERRETLKGAAGQALIFMDSQFGFLDGATELVRAVMRLLPGELDYEIDSSMPVCCFCGAPVLELRGYFEYLPPDLVTKADEDLSFFKAFGAAHTHCLEKSHLRFYWGRKIQGNVPESLSIHKATSDFKLYRNTEKRRVHFMWNRGPSLVLKDSELDDADQVDTARVTVGLEQDLRLNLTAWPEIEREIEGALETAGSYPILDLARHLDIVDRLQGLEGELRYSPDLVKECASGELACRATYGLVLPAELYRLARSAAYVAGDTTIQTPRDTLGTKSLSESVTAFLERMRPLVGPLQPSQPVPGLPSGDVVLDLFSLGYQHLLCLAPKIERVESYDHTYSLGKANNYEILLNSETHQLATVHWHEGMPFDLGLRSDEFLELCWVKAAWDCQAKLPEEYALMGLRRLSHHFFQNIPKIAVQELKKLYPSFLQRLEQYYPL